MARLVLVGFSLSLLFSLSFCDIASVTWNDKQGWYEIYNGVAPGWIAVGNFTDKISETGWSYLEVTTNESVADEVQAYCAGLVEGYLTDDLIYKHWMNTVEGYCADEGPYCSRLHKFIKTNFDWMLQNIASLQDKDPYWHQMGLLLNQLAGLEEGYSRRSIRTRKSSRQKLHLNTDAMGFIMFQIFGDLEDLEMVLNKTANLKRVKGSGSCSALVKPLANKEDLFVSQVSWNTYQSMLRVLKRYNFQYHLTSTKGSPVVPGNKMTFSSYPGLLTSGDDFYLISSGLAALETTIGNDNSALWKYVTAEGSILEWMRSVVSNRLATGGSDWTKFFIQYNSGTYNNQWMVVDYKLFTPGKPLKDNLLWVVEQLPKYYVREDRTDTLRNQGYWPSYNVPYYPFIYNASGALANAQKFGDWFSYNNTPRALIFKRDHKNVTDLSSMMKLMRYNDYKKDPLSRCNCTPPYSAENAISARSDLNPKNGMYPFAALGHRSHGGIDMKLTSFKLSSSDLHFVAVSGPTYDTQPPFQWSRADFAKDTPHLGHPDLWKFKPIVFGGQPATAKPFTARPVDRQN